MKIPTYQKQITYQRAHARPVEMVTPTLASSYGKGWNLVAAIGGAMEGAGRLYKAWEKKKEEERKRQQQAEEAAKKKPNPDSNESAAKRISAGVLPPQYSGFSSPARQNLLNFSRTQAWQDPSVNEPSSAVQTATERLDDYFVEQARTYAADMRTENPDAHLLTQDYAVLRQEMQHLQKEKQIKTQQNQFLQGAGSFVQTAGLIRQPAALEQYIQANLAAAQTESEQAGYGPSVWKNQKQQLYTAAVQQNIDAALQTGETKQARSVYQHFADKLPAQQKDLLQTKLIAREAEIYADKVWPHAYEMCVSAEREIEKNKLHALAQQMATSQGLNEQALQKTLQMRLREQICQKYEQEAAICRQLLTAGSEDKPTLWQGSQNHLSASEFAQIHQLWCDMQSAPPAISDPAVFNALYEQSSQAAASRADIMQAYQAEKISAADALRLTEHFCSVQAGHAAGYEPLLARGVAQLCQRMQLTQSETQQAQYSVFSAGCDKQTQLAAAQELKQLLTLQEKKK